eukprot:32131-Eustigmatos_ZCMA.PRE.1
MYSKEYACGGLPNASQKLLRKTLYWGPTCTDRDHSAPWLKLVQARTWMSAALRTQLMCLNPFKVLLPQRDTQRCTGGLTPAP